MEPCHLALGVADLGGAHRLEIHRLQAFAVADGQNRVDLLAGFLGRGGALLLGGQCLGEAARARRRLLRRRLGAGQLVEDFQHLVALGRAPVEAEGLVEQVLVLVAVHHGGAQGGADLDAVADVDSGHRLLGGEHVCRAHRQAGAAQEAGEVQDIEGQQAAFGDVRHGLGAGK